MIVGGITASYIYFNQARTFTVNIAVLGHGQVSVSGQGAYTTSVQVREGSQVTLTAIPDPGWKFDGWVGLNNKSNPLTLTINSDTVITAAFLPV